MKQPTKNKLKQSDFKLSIVVVSDHHGRFITSGSGKNEVVGLDSLASYLKELRNKNEHVLLIDNGDSIQGTPLVDLHDYSDSESENLIHPLSLIHNELKFDCFVLGNHEFNFGLKRLGKIKQEAKIPWLTGNINYSEDQSYYGSPYHIFEFDGVKVGIIGLCTQYVPNWENRKHIVGLEFKDVVEQTEKLLPELEKQCDITILAYHGGLEKIPDTEEKLCDPGEDNLGAQLLERFPQVDCFITGHQHQTFVSHISNKKKTLVIQTGAYAKQWGEIKIKGKIQTEADRNKLTVHSKKADFIRAERYSPDAKIKEKFIPYFNRLEGILEKRLGEAGNEFKIKDPVKDVWLKKHSLIQWINNLLLEYTGADIAGTALLKENLPGLPNVVHTKDVLENYPFFNTICIIKITGKILKEALEQAASLFYYDEKNELRIERAFDYDMWEGIDYSLNLSQPIGKRLCQLTRNGKEVKDGDIFDAAVTCYRAGGAWYKMFCHDQIVREYDIFVTDLMKIDLLKRKKISVDIVNNFDILT